MICKLNSRYFYTLSFLVDLKTFLIFRRTGIYFGPLKLDSCVNSVKTGGRHFVQESWGSWMCLGPLSELSSPWGHLAINLWPGCMSPPGRLSVFFTHSHVLWVHASTKLPGSNEGNSWNLENVMAWLLNILNLQQFLSCCLPILTHFLFWSVKLIQTLFSATPPPPLWPITLCTSLSVTWLCRCGGVSALASPQLVTLISGGAPWWVAELL